MYKLMNKDTPYQALLIERDDGSVTSIPFDPANTDYQAYLKWLEEGNTPEPADVQEP